MSNEKTEPDANSRRNSPPIFEIILVIAIIAGVCGIVAIDFCHKVDAKRHCEVNLRMISLGLLQYVDDYDEHYPPNIRGGPQGWTSAINPYIESYSYSCLSDSVSTDKAMVISYGMNSNLGSLHIVPTTNTVAFFEVSGDSVDKLIFDTNGEEAALRKRSQVSEYVSAAGDGTGKCPQYGYSGDGCGSLAYATGKIGGRATMMDQPRLRGGANYAAVDGHVKWLLPEQVSGGPTATLPICSQDNRPAILGCSTGINAAGTANTHYRMTFSPR